VLVLNLNPLRVPNVSATSDIAGDGKKRGEAQTQCFGAGSTGHMDMNMRKC